MRKNEQLIIEKHMDMYSLSDFHWKSIHIKGNVEEIIDSAFKGFSMLENVVLDYGIKHIGDYAFESCQNLVEISFPLSLKTIGHSAFDGCLKLKKFENSLLESIDDFAFYNCKNLSEIPYLGSLKHLGNYAFSGCDSLNSVSISCDIGENAFCFCKNLWSLYIYDFCEKIKQSAFAHCEKLIRVKLGENVKYIEDKAFYRCNFYELTLPASLITIGEESFAANRSDNRCNGHIKELKIPASVRKIGKRAFSGHPIEKLEFCEGLEVIDAWAFEDCLLWEIDLPKTVKEVSQYAFNKYTYVSVNGVPLSVANKFREIEDKQKQLDKEIRDIKIEKSNIENLLSKKTEQKRTSEKNIEIARDSLEQINRECVDCKIKTDIIIRQNEVILNETTIQIRENENDLLKLKAEFDDLKKELDKTFFLAISKKKELSNALEEKKSAIMLVEQQLEELRRTLCDAQEKIGAAKNAFAGKRNELEATKTYINDAEYEIKKTIEQIDTYTSRLDNFDSQLNKNEQLRLDIIAEKDAILSANKDDWKKEKLSFEKKHILQKIGTPDAKNYTVLFDNKTEIQKSISFELQTLENYVNEQLEEKNASVLATFADRHQQNISRVKEINKELEIDEFDGIEFLQKKSVTNQECENINFSRLHDMIAEKFSTNKFNQLKKALSSICVDSAKNQEITKMFAEFNSVILKGSAPDDCNVAVHIVVLPEFLILFKRAEIRIIRYSEVQVSETHTAKTHNIKSSSWKVPADCEVISKQYLHENADGTPNKRYKDNPLTIKLRHNKLIFECDTIKVVVKEESLEQSLKHVELINNFKSERKHNKELFELEQLLFSGSYNDICEFVDAQDKKIKDKQKKKEDALRQQEAETEKYRQAFEAEQQALEQEKLNRRYELIRKQKEFNDSKKIELEDIKPSKNAMTVFFGADDSEGNIISEQKSADPEEITAIFSIKEKLNITNAVFKLTLIQNVDLAEKEIVAYFVDKNGGLISNKRKLKPAGKGENISVGFILNSGIDFTVMNECQMKIESSEEILCVTDFSMNISFYSDF